MKGRKCDLCGKRFAPANNRQIYCSRLCANHAQAAALPMRACKWCGKEFQPSSPPHAFCSEQCRVKARRMRKLSPRAKIRPSHSASQNITFAKKVGPGRPTEESIDRVRAYLALPPAERWAKRGTLTETELKLAAKMHDEAHSGRVVEWNWLPH